MKKRKLQRTIRQIVFLIGLIGLWHLLAVLRVWSPYLFPSPWQVLQTLYGGFENLSIPLAIFVSLKRLIIGYGISILLGGMLGMIISKFKIVEDTIGGLVLSLQTLPSICWLPLSLLWFGLNERAIVFVVAIGSIFSITISTENGIRNVPPLWVKAGRNLGANRWKLFRLVVFPAAFPQILSGLKQGWSFAWRSLMAAELLFMGMGMGFLLMMGRELNDMSQVISVMLIIGFLSAMMDRFVFGKIEAHVKRKWGLLKRA